MVDPRDNIKIVNVVASANIGQEINLKQVTLALEGQAHRAKSKEILDLQLTFAS